MSSNDSHDGSIHLDDEKIPPAPAGLGHRQSSFTRSLYGNNANSSNDKVGASSSSAEQQLSDSVPVPKSRPTGGRRFSNNHHRNDVSVASASTAAAAQMRAIAEVLDASGSSLGTAAAAALLEPEDYAATLHTSLSSLDNMKKAPPTNCKTTPMSAIEVHEPSWGGTSASSFAREAAFLASGEDVEKKQKQKQGLPSEENAVPRPELGERQPSWYRDALGQMSAEDLQAFLNEGGASGGMTASVDGVLDTAVEGFENEQVLEQYRIMARHEARQLVKDNLGYDPVERMKERLAEQEFNGAGNLKKETQQVSLPPMSVPKISHDIDTNLCLPKGELPPSRFMEPTAMKRENELVTGKLISTTGDSEGIMAHVVRCLGCRSHLQVPVSATMVHCSGCATISPATSTRR